MFGLFGNKEIKTCAKDVVEITKIVHQIMSKLPNKKIDKNHITKQLGSHRIGVIDDHYGRGEISIPTSHRNLSATIRSDYEDDNKDFRKFQYLMIGIMEFGGFSIEFKHDTKPVVGIMDLSKRPGGEYGMPVGKLARKLQKEVIKMTGYEEQDI